MLIFDVNFLFDCVITSISEISCRNLIMDQFNNTKVSLRKEYIGHEENILSDYVKCEINDPENFSNNRNIEEENAIQTTESVEKEIVTVKLENEWKNNENENPYPSTLSVQYEIKKEVESELDTFSDDPDSKDDIPANMVELVQIKYMKVEKTDELKKDLDSININKGRKTFKEHIIYKRYIVLK